MNKDRKLRVSLVALAALGVMSMGSPAKAEPIDEVVVESTRSRGVPVEVISITRRVSYADLDLLTHAGVLQLERRVIDTANALCRQLDRYHRVSLSDRTSCIENSKSDAMVQVHKAIAAAEGRTRTAEALPPK